MKLDLDCIRDVLLTVEKYETIHNSVSFEENKQDHYDVFLSSYSTDVILYHVQYCVKANLLSTNNSIGAWGYISFDCRMEPSGHDFLANTRTAEKWSCAKNVISKIGGASLQVVSAIAEGVTTALADKYLPTEIAHIIS